VPAHDLLPNLNGAQTTGKPRGAAIQRGLLTNLLNPKALLFCSVLLPQFIVTRRPGARPNSRPGRGAGGVGLLFDSAYALTGAALGRWLQRSPSAQRSAMAVRQPVDRFRRAPDLCSAGVITRLALMTVDQQQG
jgi:threonine/homoserine/homoserine lactone efflux protein